MKRKVFKYILIYLFFLINLININNSYNKCDSYLIIDKIKLNSCVKKSNKDFSNLNYSLVYYKNINTKNKIIIFGHSMMNKGKYFNKIDELRKNDIVYLKIKNNTYKYQVNNIYTVDKKDVYILKNEYKSGKLLLVTCDKNDKNKRLIVQLFIKM